MSREAFIYALRTSDPDLFVEDQLFDRVPSVFSGDRASFISWKRLLGRLLDVDPACISLVGSAATGFSLSPNKNFRPFGEMSDVDVAVVSEYHFAIAWRYLRTNGARRLRVDNRTRNAWSEHSSRYIYWGTVATDRLLGVLPFGVQWMGASTEMGKVAPTTGRQVNLRIYVDYDALRAYQVNGVRDLRNSLTE